MTKVPTIKEFKKICKGVARVVRLADTESAASGLTLTALAFAAVLDNYAAPNEENPEGMCDDPQELRQYFADILMMAPAAVQFPSNRQERLPPSSDKPFDSKEDASKFILSQAFGAHGFPYVEVTAIIEDSEMRDRAYKIAAAQIYPDKPNGSHELFVKLQVAMKMLEGNTNG